MQLAVSREARLKLRRENRHVEVQKELVKIIAFHSRQVKNCHFTSQLCLDGKVMYKKELLFCS